eukprot:m.112920 g.112920  ORF g.112920 m.112920 type:complete len:56 (-) comp14112_c0_seq1:149-316(-)
MRRPASTWIIFGAVMMLIWCSGLLHNHNFKRCKQQVSFKIKQSVTSSFTTTSGTS